MKDFGELVLDFYDNNDEFMGRASTNEGTNICTRPFYIPYGSKYVTFIQTSGFSMGFNIYDYSITLKNVMPIVGLESTCKWIKIFPSSNILNYLLPTDDGVNINWNASSGNYGPHWLKVELDEPKVIDKYYLRGAYSWGVMYKFYLEASNDGENWVKLEGDTVHDGNINGNSTPGEYNIDIQNQTPYKYYRLYFPQGGWTYGSSGGNAINEFKLYESK